MSKALTPTSSSVLSHATELDQARAQINAIDAVLVEKLNERFAAVQIIHAYKVAHQLPTLDVRRETSLLTRIEQQSEAQWAPYVRAQFEGIVLQSRRYQNRNASLTVRFDGILYEADLSGTAQQTYLFSVLAAYGVELESLSVRATGDVECHVSLRPRLKSPAQNVAFAAFLQECQDHGLTLSAVSLPEE